MALDDEVQDHQQQDSEIDLEDWDVRPGPSQSLLGQHDTGGGGERQQRFKKREYESNAAGKRRAYQLGIIVCFGGFLFGYDSGIIGGVLTLESFATDFQYSLPNTHVASLSVGLQQLGALAACFAIWPVTHKYGRKWPIIWCSFVFIFGAVIQTINTHSTFVFYLGRLISGVGLGGSSVIVPMFSSEMAPKDIRGSIGSFYQWMFTIGIFTSYWIDFGVAQLIPSTLSRQWQIPVGLQCLFAAILGVGTMTLPESTRWLTQKRQHESAWESLKWIRASDGEDARLEMEEIREGVELEEHAKQGFQLSEMFRAPNVDRTITAAAVFTAQQATGATAFAYFGPQYFQLLVGKSGNTSLLLTAIFGAVKVVSCTLFIIFIADTIGRRFILTGGALMMAACQLTTALLVSTHPISAASSTNNSSTSTSASLTPSALGTISLIYLFVAAYNFSWGPLPWPYVSEIFPMRTREFGIALGVACQWFGNFLFSFATPYMIETLGWGTFVVWGVLDLGIAAYAWRALEETRGRSLEEIARGAVDTEGDAEDWKDD